jgi:hypothetical protein
MVADLDRGHPRPDLDHHPGALMAQHRGEQAFGIQTVEGVGVGVADARGLDLDQHLARLGPLQVQFHDLERRLGCEGDGGAGLHGRFLDGSDLIDRLDGACRAVNAGRDDAPPRVTA